MPGGDPYSPALPVHQPARESLEGGHHFATLGRAGRQAVTRKYVMRSAARVRVMRRAAGCLTRERLMGPMRGLLACAPPNGPRLSCGRLARRRSVVER